MSALAPHGASFGMAPAGARPLGSRVKPIIRLGMGVKVEGKRKDNSTYTRPEKTDYFTVRGDERAAKKFGQVYGPQPKAIKIMVPSSLALALDISYRSFIGGQSEDGGRPLALGHTNFATLGYVGGPDVLRVWKQDGTYAEIETDGLDEKGDPLDEIAKDLKIEVYTTFTFTIPDVLGWGSFAAVTSKGKKSADNLAFKLSEIYSAFGTRAPWAFDREDPPLLVLKPDTAMVRFQDKQTGDAGWGKSKIFVLDVVIPEPFEVMRDRLLDHQSQLDAAGGPAAALYGARREPQPELLAGDVIEVEPVQDDEPDESAAGAAEAGSGAAVAAEDGSSLADGETAAPTATDEQLMEAADASLFVPTSGKFAAGGAEGPLSLAAIYGLPDEAGKKYLLMVVRTLDGDWRDEVEQYMRVQCPVEFDAAMLRRAELQAAKEAA